MRKLLISLILLFASFAAFSQYDPNISWSAEVKPAGAEDEYDIIFSADIKFPWHLYDMGPYDDGPYATRFTFADEPGVELLEGVKYLKSPKRIYDKIFQMEIGYFVKSASFSQRIKVVSASPAALAATVEYQLCDDQSCLMPAESGFSLSLEGSKREEYLASVPGPENPVAESGTDNKPAPLKVSNLEKDKQKNDRDAEILPADVPSGGSQLWNLILPAILWGFAALITPCVFPMVPVTISFFLKSGDKRSGGRFRALLYGIFIVALYTLPIAVIILVTYFAGGESVTAEIFNWLATHWIPNVLFFVVFMVFAASFFGAFELRMPSKLVNSSDKNADKGGIIGVFFMALTLVLVSFSCTGPIVGTVLIKSTQGEIWVPIVTMFAFSVAFALPFVIFALFPSLMGRLPKSGGWLNSVKVVLGFIEVALGLKFLSVADQTYHWGILDREVYLAIWIVVFAMLGFYLLGKLRFKHDSEVKHIGITRLGLAIVTFSFVVYMIPGMWGAPLKALSGYLPPITSQDFVISEVRSGENDMGALRPKYSEFLRLPHGLEGFFDYDEALAYARKVKKPLLIDFTGHGCVNCREMEAKVWADPQVLKLLREEYIIVALYSDDRKELPENEWVTADNGRVLKTLGRKNAYFAAKRFGVNAQPYYIILDGKENVLVPPRGYDLDISGFMKFLMDGAGAYPSK